MKRNHFMPFGATVLDDVSVQFRLWAPKAERVDLCLQNDKKEQLPLTRLEDGWFELRSNCARAGSLYQFRVDGDVKVPDPASRFQPQDVHGPSEIVDPLNFEWNDASWKGRPWDEAVIYELHVGTFTPEGTFLGVEQKLDYLRDLGITAIELMPVADFSGSRNWGYDGVLPYAPDSSYGRPEDLKHLIQTAHAKGLMVFLDVVYNHFGPDGNYLGVYAPQFFTSRHKTPWGDAINFDGPGSRVVRDFFIHNALYWLEEYHFDGLRLDAVHAIVDDTQSDILTELAQAVRQKFEGVRFVHLILENGDNAAHYLQRDGQNRTLLYNAQWNDDIHHVLHVLITGESDGYYADYTDRPISYLCRCLGEGFAFQGEYSEFHGGERGEPSVDLPPSAFVSFLQNHDQIGNRAFGERIGQLTRPEELKAAMEILLLAPQVPMLFMGEEFGATSPFLYFCDFKGDLAQAVTQGRRNEFARFAKFAAPEMRDKIPDPNDEQTFLRSKLDWDSVGSDSHSRWLAFYRNLLSIRLNKVIPRLKGKRKVATAYAYHQDTLISVGWILSDESSLELRANLGSQRIVTTDLNLSNAIYLSLGIEESPAQRRMDPWSVIWLLKEK